MEKYDQIAVVGEGSYGVVMKCRHRESGQIVAIKKFLETEDDITIRRMALREIRLLKKLRHENLVNMIEVFRRKRRFHLVFEYVDRTLLDEVEASGGLPEDTARKHLFQLLRAIDYCHQNGVIHRDVKPENILVSLGGVVKLCDFGFARALAPAGEPHTEYVATRWYRAPELLLADNKYGPEVDIWALGCVFAEMLTGDPLFPGDSDIDQIALIIKLIGKLSPRQQELASRASASLRASVLCASRLSADTTRARLPGSAAARDLLALCLRAEPWTRPAPAALLRHWYFNHDGFIESFSVQLKRQINKEMENMPLLHRSSRGGGGGASADLFAPASTTRPRRAPAPRISIAVVDNKRWNATTQPRQNNISPSTIGYNSIMNEIFENQSSISISDTKSEINAKLKTNIVMSQNSGVFPSEQDLARADRAPPLVHFYPKTLTSYINKTNKHVLLDSMTRLDGGSEAAVPAKRQSKKNNQFSLPNVRGATHSPMKGHKQKLQPQNNSRHENSLHRKNAVQPTPLERLTTPSNLPYM